MRLIGIDYGEKRVGVAVSDEENRIAFPRAVLQNDDALLPKVKALSEEIGAESVVLGESKDYGGAYNPIMDQAFAFKAALEAMGLVVVLEPEFLTSAQAERQGKTVSLDASAAALILQSYLDKTNNTTRHDHH